MKRVHVVAGVVLDESRTHVLLAERRVDQHQGGLWEYPGGKCEPGESEAVALTRELAEEIGIDATEMSPLMVVEHDYPDKSVTLAFYAVTAFNRAPIAQEGQRLQWVPVDALHNFAFPAANQGVARAVSDWLSAQENTEDTRS